MWEHKKEFYHIYNKCIKLNIVLMCIRMKCMPLVNCINLIDFNAIINICIYC